MSDIHKINKDFESAKKSLRKSMSHVKDVTDTNLKQKINHEIAQIEDIVKDKEMTWVREEALSK